MYLLIYVFMYLFSYLFMYLFIYLCIYYLSIHPSVRRSVRPSVRLSIFIYFFNVLFMLTVDTIKQCVGYWLQELNFVSEIGQIVPFSRRVDTRVNLCNVLLLAFEMKLRQDILLFLCNSEYVSLRLSFHLMKVSKFKGI